MNTLFRACIRTLPILPLILFAPSALADFNWGGTVSGDGWSITFGSGGGTIQNIFVTILTILNGYVVPIIFAIAFIVFLWGLFRYFIQGGADEKERQKGRQLIIWGIIGFAVMFSLWGLVNIVLNTFGLQSSSRPPVPTAIPGLRI